MLRMYRASYFPYYQQNDLIKIKDKVKVLVEKRVKANSLLRLSRKI